MTIKNIALIFSGSRSEIKTIKYCEKIANNLKANLKCVYPSFEYEQLANFAFGAGAASSDIYSDFKNRFEHEHLEKLRKAEKIFRETIESKKHKFVSESGNINEITAHFGKYCDMIFLDSDIEEMNQDFDGVLHTAIFETGTAVLLTNEKCEVKLPKKALIAWDGSLRAARAVKSAVDILSNTDEVLVVGVNESDKDIASASQILEYLAGHGIKAKHLGIKKAHFSIGQTIHEEAQKQSCDLIVMGAYTHNRVRQAILGGATKYILGHTDIPVLMQH